jgi:dihydrofolate reductase
MPAKAARASVFVGVSVDGFLARPDGRLDFLDAGGHAPHGYDEFVATVDAMLIGRNTLETVIGFGGAWAYGRKPVFVLTSRPLPPLPPDATVERVTGTPAAILDALGARGIRHAYVDGGITIQQFLAAGLVERLIVTRVPILIGAGIPLFGALPKDILLRHVATKTFEGGLVQTEYAMERD